MRSYIINFPRGLEVDIFNLPEDFKEQVEQAFKEYTSGTAKAYMYVDKLGFIDRCVECLNGDEDSDDVVNSLVEETMAKSSRKMIYTTLILWKIATEKARKTQG
jgi:hypothetical protein